MLEPCKRCFYTIMANYDGSLDAVDCHIHSVRYDMDVNKEARGHLRCFIRYEMVATLIGPKNAWAV
eukprot:scaffold8008_cov141-Skeletonema_marinoi.AAC.3